MAGHLEWHMRDQGIDFSRGPALAEVIGLYAERCNTLKELAAQSRYLYEDFSEFEAGAAKKHLRPVAAEPLALARTRLAELADWQPAAIHEVVNAVAAELELGMGKVGMPLRVAVTGIGQSPAIDGVMALLGKDKVLARIDMALAFIAERAQG
ncbi:hypothetical protein MBH78_11670 [Oceanimonas sp. NS1]|nr:hypothetical protein [Oceanimonas sp. NS1]